MRKIEYLLFLQNIRTLLNGVWDGFFLTLTRLAESPIPFLFLAWIYWCSDKRAGQIISLNTGLSCVINQALKALVRVPRPWLRDERIQPVQEALPSAAGTSFPSGHTTRAGCAYGSYGAELIRKKEKKSGAFFLILILLIAFSRNWLGVHTIEDILVGALLVVIGHFLVSKALSWAEKKKNRDLILCAVACILTCLLMAWLGLLSNGGYCFGSFVGWLFERRFVHFTMPENNMEKIRRGLPGLLGILLISTAYQTCLATLLPGGPGHFCSGFFLAFFIMAVYPAIYTWTAKTKRSIAIILTALVFLFPFVYSQAIAEEPHNIAVIGHRGFAASAPENTMPAFEKAVAQGVDYVELDVQLSVDRQIVVCHDDNLKRTTGMDAPLSSMTMEEIKQLDAGSWFSAEYTGTQIPTLEEVLDLINPTGIRIYLELKDIGEDKDFPLEVYRLTQDCQMTDRCVFASFQYEYLKIIKDHDPNAKVLLNTTISETSLPDDYPSDYYGIRFSSFSAELADAIHQKGSVVFVWTVDDPEQMADVIAKGADGICSNCPDKVQEYLFANYQPGE